MPFLSTTDGGNELGLSIIGRSIFFSPFVFGMICKTDQQLPGGWTDFSWVEDVHRDITSGILMRLGRGMGGASVENKSIFDFGISNTALGESTEGFIVWEGVGERIGG